MQPSSQRNIAFERLMNRLPPEIITSFSDAQLTAIRDGMASRPWRSHPVDIRFTIPFIRLYFVFLMGPERRSSERLAQERQLNAIWTPANIAVILTVIGVSVGAMVGALQLRSLNFSSANEDDIHPVVVPFKGNREECEGSGRDWQDGKCIDYEHNPRF
ncbi:MAG: hypothetical protein QNJ46_15920 [Leptolyngbyaceae cyanobacterium MO_188.B28]|nr:hypothetical protein [Leptolyngbyaceae cyanobacterium MO_188.B28]